MGSEWILWRLTGGGLDSTGSGYVPVASCCECGDEPKGSCPTDLVIGTRELYAKYGSAQLS
jgi:hypothetical protein